MHFGLIPRSHRGIFCMNELPDLSPKIQVGLFNVLEERDVQIRGFTVRLPLDLCMVFSANPEDYTNRGRIVTPLKDRIGSVIRTHYPESRDLGIAITDENAWVDRNSDVAIEIPWFMKAIVEEVSRLARTSPHVNQSSGVSVRMSVANYENLISNTERRAFRDNEQHAVPRISDLAHAAAGSRGKVELSMTEEPGEEDGLIGRIVGEAVMKVFDEYRQPKQYRALVEYFEGGETLTVGDGLSTADYVREINKFTGLRKAVDELGNELEPKLMSGPFADALKASLAEFVLEGLHTHNRLNKDRRGGKNRFTR